MIVKDLYTGKGVSLSPKYEEGRTLSNHVRLIADENMAITNGMIVTTCADVLRSNISLWSDCDIPTEMGVCL